MSEARVDRQGLKYAPPTAQFSQVETSDSDHGLWVRDQVLPGLLGSHVELLCDEKIVINNQRDNVCESPATSGASSMFLLLFVLECFDVLTTWRLVCRLWINISIRFFPGICPHKQKVAVHGKSSVVCTALEIQHLHLVLHGLALLALHLTCSQLLFPLHSSHTSLSAC